VKSLKPTAIIGVGATPGLFTKEVVEEIDAPQRAADRVCAVEPDLQVGVHRGAGLRMVRRQGFVASGSPFAPVDFGGQHFVPRQGNNSYIFRASDSAWLRCARRASPTRCSWRRHARSPSTRATPTWRRAACIRR